MEIERKWMVDGWPEGLPLLRTAIMRQGYLCTRPTVRIREEAFAGGNTQFILCLKSAGSADGLVRQEIEIAIPEETFREIEKMIGIPLIEKERREYALSDGLILEVNDVDRGLPSHFMYAEIEYRSEEEAREWTPDRDGLPAYLADDVTGEKGQTMGAFWNMTRLGLEVSD